MDVSLGNEFSCSSMIVPRGGPKTIPMPLTFDGVNPINVNCLQAIQLGVIEYIQSLYIDNADNASQLIITMGNLTRERIIIPPHSQAYMPIYLDKTNPVVTFNTTGALTLIVEFTNIPAMPIIWNTVSSSGSAISGPTLLGSAQTTDNSFALDGTSQTLFIAGEATHYLLIQNPIGNANVTVNLAGGDAAASGFVLIAGGTLEIANGLANAVTVKGTNTQTIQAIAG